MFEYRHIALESTWPKTNSAQTNSAQNQVGPKPSRPKTNSALDYEIFLLPGLRDLSPLFFSFLFSFSSSSIVCIIYWEFISLKVLSINSKKLEIWSAVTFKLLLWCEFKCTVWNGNESENPFLISGITKNADFFSRKWKKKILFCSKDFWKGKNWKFEFKKIYWLENHVKTDFFFPIFFFFFKFLI